MPLFYHHELCLCVSLNRSLLKHCFNYISLNTLPFLVPLLIHPGVHWLSLFFTDGCVHTGTVCHYVITYRVAAVLLNHLELSVLRCPHYAHHCLGPCSKIIIMYGEFHSTTATLLLFLFHHCLAYRPPLSLLRAIIILCLALNIHAQQPILGTHKLPCTELFLFFPLIIPNITDPPCIYYRSRILPKFDFPIRKLS